MTGWSAPMSWCGRSSASRRRAARSRLTFFEFNTLAALLVFEAAAARCLGARDRHGRPIGRGQCGRSGCCRGGQHRIRPSGIPGHDARGHRAREGGHFQARHGRPCSAAATCPRSSRRLRADDGRAAQALGAANTPTSREASDWHFRGSRWDLPHLPAPALMGETQFANAATAMAALEEIDARLTIPPRPWRADLSEVRLAARFQVIAPATPGAPTWILDVAHNPAAARVLAPICATPRAAGGPWPCAESWPTRMRRESPPNCAAASMRGGAYRPRENEAATARQLARA